MLYYKGQALTKFKDKTAGKNKGAVDGFYQTPNGAKYFVKKPSDPLELFAEVFSGLLLEEFKSRNLIFPPEAASSLICADVIKCDDGSYALIQPAMEFTELFHLIGTQTRDGKDRSALTETILGPSYYASLTNLGESFGLSLATMFSLLLGAHSVHSGNIVVMKAKYSHLLQFGRIDWGDAFRHLGHPDNNEDIIYAYENQGRFNVKQLTKSYFFNYKNIKGLFPAMAEKATEFKKRLTDELLLDIIEKTLSCIPVDLIDQQTKAAFATYAYIASFKDVVFGSANQKNQFAVDLARLLNTRLNKITELTDLPSAFNSKNIHNSILPIQCVSLIVDGEEYYDSIEKIRIQLDKDKQFKTDELNLEVLTVQFNNMLKNVAIGTADYDCWDSADHKPNTNIFAAYHNQDTHASHGSAFIAQYKEETIFYRMFALDPHTFDAQRLTPFEQPVLEYIKAHPDSLWSKLNEFLVLNLDIITLLKLIKNAQSCGMDDLIQEQLPSLIEKLNKVYSYGRALDALIMSKPEMKQSAQESHYFYPITHDELLAMSDDQLVTICLEELNAQMPSALLIQVLTNTMLLERAQNALKQDRFSGCANLPYKLELIKQWQAVAMITATRYENCITNQQGLITELQDQLHKESSVHQVVKYQLDIVQQQHTELNNNLSKVIAEKTELQSSIAVLNNDLETANKAPIALQQRIQELETNLSAVNSQLRDEQAALKFSREEAQQAKSAIEEMEQLHSVLFAQNQVLQEYLASKTQSISSSEVTTHQSPPSHGLIAGTKNRESTLDPADKPQGVGAMSRPEQLPSDLLKQLNSKDEQLCGSLIHTQLIPLTDKYLEHLRKQDQTEIVAIKIKLATKLRDTVNNDSAISLPSERIKAFSALLKTSEQQLSEHRDPAWSRYAKNCLIVIGLVCTGIIPGIVALLSYAGIKGKSPLFFSQSQGEQFVAQAEQLTPKVGGCSSV